MTTIQSLVFVDGVDVNINLKVTTVSNLLYKKRYKAVGATNQPTDCGTRFWSRFPQSIPKSRHHVPLNKMLNTDINTWSPSSNYLSVAQGQTMHFFTIIGMSDNRLGIL